MSHFVKCKICEQRFDRDLEEAVLVGGRRYAHTKCAEENPEISQASKDLDALHAYLKLLFKDNYNYFVLQKQIEKYIEINKYSSTGILKALVWWYNIQGNILERANNRIGIVPYIYQDAYNYYLSVFMARQINATKNIAEYKEPPVREVRIKTPERERPKHKLFDLDD